MKILKKIKHIDLILSNEFEVDEIVRKYGSTGDAIEKHFNPEYEVKTTIKRKFSQIEYFEEIEVFDLTEEEYYEELKYQEHSGKTIYTSLNYDEFINDFDYNSFSTFFENFEYMWLDECNKSIEKIVLKSSEHKSKILLKKLFGYITYSNQFLNNFNEKEDTNKVQKNVCRQFLGHNKQIEDSLKRNYELVFTDIFKNESFILNNNPIGNSDFKETKTIHLKEFDIEFKKIINSVYLEEFDKIEANLIQNKIIDNEKKWVEYHGSKTNFIKFCICLYERNYLIKKLMPKTIDTKESAKVKEKAIKETIKFFEKRYKTNVGDQGKPCKVKNIKFNNLIDFTFIEKQK